MSLVALSPYLSFCRSNASFLQQNYTGDNQSTLHISKKHKGYWFYFLFQLEEFSTSWICHFCHWNSWWLLCLLHGRKGVLSVLLRAVSIWQYTQNPQIQIHILILLLCKNSSCGQHSLHNSAVIGWKQKWQLSRSSAAWQVQQDWFLEILVENVVRRV